MTRPTNEQIKALRNGDVVTVRAVVKNDGPDETGDLTVRLTYSRGKNYAALILASEIMTIEPREIKVGDRVYYSNVPHDLGTVRHVEAGRAAIMFDSGVFSAYNLETLRVIP